jgi:hypothetical protein
VGDVVVTVADGSAKIVRDSKEHLNFASGDGALVHGSFSGSFRLNAEHTGACCVCPS